MASAEPWKRCRAYNWETERSQWDWRVVREECGVNRRLERHMLVQINLWACQPQEDILLLSEMWWEVMKELNKNVTWFYWFL